MRLTVSITVLLLGLAPVALAQDVNTVSLADVARQSRAHSGQAKKSWDDQNSDFGRSTEDSGTPCGATISEIPGGFVAGLIGQPVKDPNVAKALTRWLEKHPDLDLIHPEDLAKLNFPRTPAQATANQQEAHSLAQIWLGDATVAANSGNQNDFDAAVGAAVNTPAKSNAGAVLAQAVDAEQQRRVRSDGSEADKVQEAVNMYSICEARRQQQFEGEIDKLAKQEFQKAVANVQAKATANAQDSQAHGL